MFTTNLALMSTSLLAFLLPVALCKRARACSTIDQSDRLAIASFLPVSKMALFALFNLVPRVLVTLVQRWSGQQEPLG